MSRIAWRHEQYEQESYQGFDGERHVATVWYSAPFQTTGQLPPSDAGDWFVWVSGMTGLLRRATKEEAKQAAERSWAQYRREQAR